MDGMLNINKPEGITSHAAVAAVRRATGCRRVGHGGTLDPLASGVLPVGVGRGTRVIEFLAEASKVYVAEVELGQETDTYDAVGQVTATGDATAVSRENIEDALGAFRGSIEQIPPMYSALKQDGRRLYELAREGITVERKSRPVVIYNLVLLGYKPPVVSLEIECSKGTYIRSIAYDLGRALGCGGHLKKLVRTRYGPFDIKNAVSLPELEEGNWQELLMPVDTVISDWPRLVVSEERAKLIANGQLMDFASDDLPEASAKRLRVYDEDGGFLAVMSYQEDSGNWHPDKVFRGRDN